MSEIPTPTTLETSQAGSHPGVPFNRFRADELDKKYVLEALESGQIAGDGSFSRRCEVLLAQITGANAALLTTSGTAALEMIALLLDIGPGDEVILPSFTFPSTANAFVLRGARPVFIDIRRDTLNLDETLLNDLISPRTRAIVAMHYGGVACEMDAIKEVADRRGVTLVEDNATGLFGSYRGRMLGSIGELAALSHHETKNLSSGEGGTLLINKASFVSRAEVLREKGTDRASFVRGELEQYTWVDLGSSFMMSEILAALLLAQLDDRDAIQARRRQIWLHYAAGLQDWARQQDVGLPFVPAHCQHPSHLFYLILPTEAHRNAFVAHMSARGIGTASHYIPLHDSLMGQRFGAAVGDCPVAQDISRRLVRLPLYPSLSPEEQDRVIEAVKAFKA